MKNFSKVGLVVVLGVLIVGCWSWIYPLEGGKKSYIIIGNSVYDSKHTFPWFQKLIDDVSVDQIRAIDNIFLTDNQYVYLLGCAGSGVGSGFDAPTFGMKIQSSIIMGYNTNTYLYDKNGTYIASSDGGYGWFGSGYCNKRYKKAEIDID